MKYLISKDQQNHGPLDINEVNERVQNGFFKPTDFAWTEGWNDWRPISIIEGYKAPPPTFATPPPPPPAPNSDRQFSFENPPPVSHVAPPPVSQTTRLPQSDSWPPLFPWEGLPPATKKMVGWGYACGCASILLFPPFLGVAGVVLGILLLTKNVHSHGIAIISASTFCAIMGVIIGVSMAG